jgi:hypothetical protein
MTNRSPSVLIAAVSAALACAASAPALAGPSLSTNWTATTLSQPECMRRAETAVRDARLARGFEIVGQSVFGGAESYTLVVRCIADKGLVYFAVGGPSLEQARKYQRSVFDKF